MNRTLCVVSVGLASWGCAARQDTSGTSKRIADLEAKVATLEATPMPVAAVADKPRPPKKRPTDESLPPAWTVELNDLRQRVVVLEGSLDHVFDELEAEKFGDVLAQKLRRPRGPGAMRVELKPDVTYSVPVVGNAMRGDPNAKVTWVIGFETTEPFTRKFLEIAKTVTATYGNDLRIVFKHHVVHSYGVSAAMLLCAADRQGKFEEGLTRMLQIPLTNKLEFRYRRLAPSFNFLDAGRLEADLATCKKLVREDHVFAKRMGEQGTPYSFINGRFIRGAQSVENLKKLIDEELAKATAELGGKPSRGYYDSVVRRGMKQP